MRMSAFGFRRVAMAAVVVAGSSVLPTAVLSDQVALKSPDGTVNLVGEFVKFEDDHYILRTALGDLRIAASRVNCEGSGCPTFEAVEADVLFAGSDTVGLGLMPLLLEGFAGSLDAEATIKDTNVENEIVASFIADGGFGEELGSYLVNSTSSGNAFKALVDKSAQFGMASRRIKPEEARALKDAGAGNMVSPDQEHIVAIDSLVVITNPQNPVREIRTDQLAAIYAGKITNWRELGGEDRPIKVINRQSSSGTRSVFYEAVFGGNDPETAASTEVVAEDNNIAADMVNEDPGAIGFVGYAFQRGAKPLTLINECGMPTEPDDFSAKVEEYTLQRRLYVYNRADNFPKSAQDFIDYAMSEEADEVIAKSGFIDLGIKRRPQQMDGARARMLLDPNADAYEGGVMREMLAQMVDYDRLSTTFRFRTGVSKLDERGALDMARLANYLEKMPEGTKVMFVGFTDDVGAFESNRNLSLARAQQVADELRTFAGDRLPGIEFASAGFGEIAPATCNLTEQGRAINRRVEVWIGADRQG